MSTYLGKCSEWRPCGGDRRHSRICYATGGAPSKECSHTKSNVISTGHSTYQSNPKNGSDISHIPHQNYLTEIIGMTTTHPYTPPTTDTPQEGKHSNTGRKQTRCGTPVLPATPEQ